MDTANSLARIVPPGNYYAVTTMRTVPSRDRPLASVRMFKDVGAAAGYAAWATSKGNDVYHSQASFRLAEAKVKNGFTHYEGSKDASNVASIRALFMDLDAHRPGDKKVVGKNAYATKRDALIWLMAFVAAVGLPQPSVIVDSGWGIHPYWLLEDALPPAQWQLLASALQQCALAHGFIGDAGIIGDVARILRTPGSINHKDPANTQPVKVLATNADVPNAVMSQLLAPWVGMQTQQAQAVGGTATVSPLFSGQKAAAFAAGTPGVNMAAAAQNIPAGVVPTPVPYSMARIAKGCPQVAQSLAAGGAGDAYPLWNDMLLLSSFTVDGLPDGWAHQLSKGDPRYSQAAVDNQVLQIDKERAKKPALGPPTCTRLGAHRPAACASCPFAGKITSPIVLGREQDLPDGFRRGKHGIEMRLVDDAGTVYWDLILRGDITNFLVDDNGQGPHVVHFRYIHMQAHREVSFAVDEMLTQGPKLRAFFSRFSIIATANEQAKRIEAFIMSWLERIQQDSAVRTDRMPAFGWAGQRGKIVGFAIAGTMYKMDGSDEPTRSGDSVLINHYREIGDIAPWRVACDLITAQRADLSCVVAASFGAPLMLYTSQPGAMMSVVSRMSGIGKTSAIKVGQAVWGDPVKGINSLNDTANAVTRRLAETRHLPNWWDEMRAQGDGRDFVQLAFQLAQGKEKARLNSNSDSREVSEWCTILTVASNESMIDIINDVVQNTEAGALRCFEWTYDGAPIQHIPGVTQAIGAVATNYGSAGRIYARWLAANHALVKRQVAEQYDRVFTALGAHTEERFYVALITSLLLGASYSNHLGLTNLDTRAMKEFLFETFHELRHARHSNSVSTQTGFNLEQILFDFAAQNQPYKLSTETFIPMVGTPARILESPRDSRIVTIHVAAQAKMMRINRTAFKDYLRKRRISPTAVEQEMGTTWGATVKREMFAAGTAWSIGRGWVVEIPLILPSLASGFLPARNHQSTT